MLIPQLTQHKTKITIACLIALILGVYPTITAKSVAGLIDDNSENKYLIYSLCLISQAILARIQEYILQNLQASLFPKIRHQIIKRHNPNDPTVQESANKIANFSSNLWGPCFLIKSLALLISSCIIMLTSKNTLTLWWSSSILAIIILAVLWQPKTNNIIKKKHKIYNKFLISNSNHALTASLIINHKLNNRIFKQQFIKTIIISTIILIITQKNWQTFSNHEISFGTTLMTLHMSINTSEIIWWLQHELSLWRLQIQNFQAAKKQLLKQT